MVYNNIFMVNHLSWCVAIYILGHRASTDVFIILMNCRKLMLVVNHAINPLEKLLVWQLNSYSLVHDYHYYNEKTFPQGYLNLKKCFLSTTCIVMYVTVVKLQSHSSVLPVQKGLRRENVFPCVEHAGNMFNLRLTSL